LIAGVGRLEILFLGLEGVFMPPRTHTIERRLQPSRDRVYSQLELVASRWPNT
jgi:hypothetical protein